MESERILQAKQKKGQLTAAEKAWEVSKAAALPVALGAYLIRRWLKQRKAQKAKPAAQQSTSQAPQKEARKARREYKVKRDELESMLAQDDGGYPHVGDEGDDTMEVYEEEEVEAAGSAAAGGAPPNQMIEMLKSMGFRMVVDKASGQIYMVPPGAKAPNETEGIAEGDEEGYDEDEDGEEEDE